MRSRLALVAVAIIGSVVVGGLTPVLSTAGAVARPGTSAAPFTALPAVNAHRDVAERPDAVGENPPGRVTQIPGQAGYEVPSGNVTSVSTTVTIPSISCNSGSNPDFGDVVTSVPSPGVTIGFEADLEVATEIIYNCGAGEPTFSGWSTLDPTCQREYGLGFCYYEGFVGGSVNPGDQVEIQASLSTTSSSTSITDLTTGASLSYTGTGFTVSNTAVEVDTNDLCMLPGGTSEPCSDDDYTSPIPPPGYANYSPFTYSNTQIDGTGLGSYLAGANSAGWIQLNDVWGTTLEAQSTYVGSGETFTLTEANLTLPTVSLSSPRINQPMSSPANLTFTATLSFASTYPVYVDYDTQDGTAFAGQNYTATNGTLYFPPGTVTESFSVPVLPQPETNSDSNTNSIYLTANLINPSYVVGGASAAGTINEGPIVTAVTPGVIPLNGGPGTVENVSGYDLSNVVSAKFCPVAATGGGNCISGTSVTVLNDNALTVVAPDATNSLVDGYPFVTTDTEVTDNLGVTSPVDNPADQVVFGCEQQSTSDGAWQVNGCLTDETDGDDVSQQTSYLDGLPVTASSTDDTNYDPGSDSVSSANTTVGLPLTSTQVVQIFKGQLSEILASGLTFSLPANTQLGGIGLSGTLTLTPAAGLVGQASGTVTATLPPVLGGSTGTLSFTTTTGSGLTSVKITVPKANFMQLFALTNVTMTYTASSGTWTVSGTASSGGNTKTTFSGSLVYTNNTLKSASLKLGAISIAGLINISNLNVSYASGNWLGSATVTQGSQSASVSMAFQGSTLTSAEIKTGATTLFGAINVNSFDMTYASGAWGLEVTSTLPGGGTSSATLNVSNGEISQATFALSDVSIYGVTINSASIGYSQTSPDPTCPTVMGTEIWCGGWDIAFPDTTSGLVSGVTGTLGFQDGQYAYGSIGVSGSVPLIDGVFLTQLGAKLSVNPPPTVASGSATITFGPTINNASALSLMGTFSRTFPTSGTVGLYDVSGTITALPGSSSSLVLGTANVSVPDTGATKVKMTLGGGPKGLSVSVGSATATITGVVNGTFTGSSFTITGNTSITVPVLGTFTGSLKADNTGIAACASAGGSAEVGFEYYWNGTIEVFDSSGCSEHGF